MVQKGGGLWANKKNIYRVDRYRVRLINPYVTKMGTEKDEKSVNGEVGIGKTMPYHFTSLREQKI